MVLQDVAKQLFKVKHPNVLFPPIAASVNRVLSCVVVPPCTAPDLPHALLDFEKQEVLKASSNVL